MAAPIASCLSNDPPSASRLLLVYPRCATQNTHPDTPFQQTGDGARLRARGATERRSDAGHATPAVAYRAATILGRMQAHDGRPAVFSVCAQPVLSPPAATRRSGSTDGLVLRLRRSIPDDHRRVPGDRGHAPSCRHVRCC
ncbi:hypothetical protein AcW1_002822 [Taiwanofungus camphoratus]|nr:hypothetical protein AcW1_002822 [Antrodia cinnamomea]